MKCEIPAEVSDLRQRLWTCFAIKSATYTGFTIEEEGGTGPADPGAFLGPKAVSLERSNPVRKSNPFGDVICKLKDIDFMKNLVYWKV